MRISDLIKGLREVKKKHGDLKVFYENQRLNELKDWRITVDVRQTFDGFCHSPQILCLRACVEK